MALEPAMGCPRSSASDSEDESAYRHADCCKDARDGNALFAEECSNSLSQCLVFKEEPPDGFTDSVELGLESCFVRGEGFEPRLYLKFEVGALALKLFYSISNRLLNFGVVSFRQFLALPGIVLLDFGSPVLGILQLRLVVSELVPRSRHGLPYTSQFSRGLGDPRGVQWRVLDGFQSPIVPMTSLAAPERSFSSMDSMFLGRVSSALWSVSTISLPSLRDAPDLKPVSPIDLRSAYAPPAPYLRASVSRPSLDLETQKPEFSPLRSNGVQYSV